MYKRDKKPVIKTLLKINIALINALTFKLLMKRKDSELFMISLKKTHPVLRTFKRRY